MSKSLSWSKPILFKSRGCRACIFCNNHIEPTVFPEVIHKVIVSHNLILAQEGQAASNCTIFRGETSTCFAACLGWSQSFANARCQVVMQDRQLHRCPGFTLELNPTNDNMMTSTKLKKARSWVSETYLDMDGICMSQQKLWQSHCFSQSDFSTIRISGFQQTPLRHLQRREFNLFCGMSRFGALQLDHEWCQLVLWHVEIGVGFVMVILTFILKVVGPKPFCVSIQSSFRTLEVAAKIWWTLHCV